MESLAINSQGSLTFEKGLVNCIPVTLLRDSEASCIGISHQIIYEKDISYEYIKFVTFEGTIE